MSTPAFRASATAAWHDTANTTITKPAGAVDGDGLLAGIYRDSDTAVTPPSGWALLSERNHSGSTMHMWIYWKRASGEGASWTWTHAAAAGGAEGWVIAVSGPVSDHPLFDGTLNGPVDADGNEGTDTSVECLGITLDETDSMLVAIAMWGVNGHTGTPPANGGGFTWTERIDSADDVYVATAAPTPSVKGATGDKVITQSLAGAWTSLLVGIRGQVTVLPPGLGPALGYGNGRLRRMLRRWLAEGPNLLATTLAAGEPPPALPDGQRSEITPLLVRRARPLKVGSWPQLLLTGLDTIYGAPGQAPSFTFAGPLTRTRRLSIEQPPDLLITVLAVAPESIPDGQRSQDPSLLEQRRVLRLDLAPNLLGTTLAAAAPESLPDGRQDYGRRTVSPVVVRLDHLTNRLTLVGQDVIYGAPGQAPSIPLVRLLPRKPLPRGESFAHLIGTTLELPTDLLIEGASFIVLLPRVRVRHIPEPGNALDLLLTAIVVAGPNIRYELTALLAGSRQEAAAGAQYTALPAGSRLEGEIP